MNSNQHEKTEEVLKKVDLKEKKGRSVLAEGLSSNKRLFEIYHEKNIAAFYQTHLKGRDVDSIRVLGGYGYHHSEIIKHFFKRKQIVVNRIIEKPITILVEQIGVFID